MTTTPEASGPTAGDPLERAAALLDSIGVLPLERHPDIFATFDELLRQALESPPHVSSG